MSVNSYFTAKKLLHIIYSCSLVKLCQHFDLLCVYQLEYISSGVLDTRDRQYNENQLAVVNDRPSYRRRWTVGSGASQRTRRCCTPMPSRRIGRDPLRLVSQRPQDTQKQDETINVELGFDLRQRDVHLRCQERSGTHKVEYPYRPVIESSDKATGSLRQRNGGDTR